MDGLLIGVPCGFGGAESLTGAVCHVCLKTRSPRIPIANIRIGMSVAPFALDWADRVVRLEFACDLRINIPLAFSFHVHSGAMFHSSAALGCTLRRSLIDSHDLLSSLKKAQRLVRL